MKKITLTKEQVKKIIKRGRAEITDDKFVEIFKNNIIFNNNGKIYDYISAELIFKKHEIEFEHVYNAYVENICDHFNLDPCDVILLFYCSEYYDFKLRFSDTQYGLISVCNKSEAIANAKALEFDINKNSSKRHFGPYRQLGNSFFCFRWLDDFEIE